MSNVFDKTRFWNLLKWDMTTNWRSFSNPFFGALAGLFCTYIGMSTMVRHITDPVFFNTVLTGMAVMSYGILMLYMMFAGAMFFWNLKTKQRYINFLCLPASNLEKFLSRFIMSTVGMLIAFLVAVLVADVARLLIGWMMGVKMVGSVFVHFLGFGWPEHGPLLNIMEAWGELFRNHDLFIAGIIASVMCYHAVYMAGSVLFRRHAILLTTLFLMVFSLVQGLFGVEGFLSGFSAGMNAEYGDFDCYVDINSLLRGITENVLIAIVCYWVTFKLFCRSQVINNKWLNL